MDTFLIVLIMIALIGLSNVIHRFIPFIPIPLIQIAAGVLLALVPGHIHLPLDPELFLVLFIAPLLFNDGKRFPRGELWKLRVPILMLVLGLVFVTVLVAGYSIHAMVPSITLPAAFALAAVLSPTDAVAVSALSSRVHLPKTIHRVLEGEALVNDASGLVAFKFAIAVAVTGVFSLPRAQFRLALGEMRRFFGRLFARDEDRLTSEHILFRYRQIINRLKRHNAAQDSAADILAGKEEQRLSPNREAIQEQRNTVQEMFEDVQFRVNSLASCGNL